MLNFLCSWYFVIGLALYFFALAIRTDLMKAELRRRQAAAARRKQSRDARRDFAEYERYREVMAAASLRAEQCESIVLTACKVRWRVI